jgi:hypothetical protein
MTLYFMKDRFTLITRMMGFSMPYFKKLSLLLALLGTLLLGAATVRAEGISVRHAEVTATEEGYFLNADFDLELTPVLEEALNRGVSLTFTVSMEIIEPRWYWFNKDIVNLRQERRLSFNPLMRVYRFSIGSLYLSFNTLRDALQALTRLNGVRIADPGSMKKGEHYEARAQMRLDVSQLPKPFQVDALSSNDWNLASKPLSWTVSP